MDRKLGGLAVLMAMLLSGCNAVQDLEQSKEDITLLKTQIEALRTETEIQKIEITTLKTEVSTMSWTGSVAYMSTTKPGYSTVKTDITPLLISFSSVAAVGPGTKLYLSVGNPSTATLSDTKITVNYAVPPAKEGENKTAKQVTQEMMQDMSPGKWTFVEVILPAIKPDQLDDFTVSVQTSTVRLRF